MSTNIGDELTTPVLMTCGELIRQEEQYIREYAAVSACASSMSLR